MGAAAAALAGELGAEVTVLDLRLPAGESVRFIQTDLGDPAAIDAALAAIGGPIDALLNCQGISGAAPGTPADLVMRVNFLGVRHVAEGAMALMRKGGAVVSIASTGGLGWPRRLEAINELLDRPGFEAGLEWVAGQEELLSPTFPAAYSFSKQALVVWTMRRSVSAIAAGIRVNATSPGSTSTPLAGDFPAEGVEFTNRPSGRSSVPLEQAWPLVFLASPAASYVNGVNLVVDGGHSAARTLGLLS
jgi:NAD(P)-dependent dehydrogenase (short-subunit alcohol dehydrogenase family)